MARYFFDLHECGDVSIDHDGLQLPDMDAALRAALEAARDIMSAEVRAGQLCLSCHIDIRDESGATACRLPFKDAIRVTGV